MVDTVCEMPCYHPLDAFQERPGLAPYFGERRRPSDNALQLPCGQCIGCRLDKSRDWALRCMFEAGQYMDNSFITLTYDDENLPKGNSLVVSHFQKFMKRLRKRYAYKKIRFFQCGEYGEELKRPHYHAILFNHRFEDQELWSERLGNKLYVSEELMELWPFGFSTVGEVTFESAAYVARYVTKKVTGKLADKINEDTGLKHYERIDAFSGEIVNVLPEYCTMSRRPGIAKAWFDKYRSETYRDDYVILQGKKVSVPRYFDRLLKESDERLLRVIKNERKIRLLEHKENNTEERLRVREEVKKSQFGMLKRGLE